MGEWYFEEEMLKLELFQREPCLLNSLLQDRFPNFLWEASWNELQYLVLSPISEVILLVSKQNSKLT